MRTDGFQQVLTRWGGDAEVERDGLRSAVRGFLQPVTRPEQLPRKAGPLGTEDQRLWIYLGQGPVAAGDTVRWQGTDYAVRSAEPVCVGATLSHWWAVLERKREAVL